MGLVINIGLILVRPLRLIQEFMLQKGLKPAFMLAVNALTCLNVL